MRRINYQIGFVPSLQLIVGAHAVVVLLLTSSYRRRRGSVLGELGIYFKYSFPAKRSFY